MSISIPTGKLQGNVLAHQHGLEPRLQARQVSTQCSGAALHDSYACLDGPL